MLRKLLDKLASGAIFQISDLGRELGVSPEMVVQMLRDLERMGYVERPLAEDGRCCAGCGGSCGCCSDMKLMREDNRETSWVLTERARRAA